MKQIILLAMAVIASFPAIAQFRSEDFTPARKLQATQQMIEALYVDSVPEAEMVDNAIIAMLKTLDPHSSYTDAKETRELTEPLQGNFSGIGIQFKMLNDTLYVVQTIAGGPSEKAGIVAGDRIIAANDTAIAGVKMVNTDVMKHLRGPKGSTVKLDVVRRSSPKPLVFKIVRDDIPLYSIDAAYMAAPGVGYVKVSRFAESTADELRQAMADLSKQGMRDIIIDLESNGGGYLQSAIEMADMFLPANSPVVYTEGMRARPAHYNTPADGPYGHGRVVVMVDQYSASASEIFSGAMQDNDRGVVVGRRTFGKGLVQRPIPFPDGSMIRLTVARYHTPSGRCIQKPYTMGDDEDYQLDIRRRYDAGEFLSADSIHFADSLRYSTLRLGRPVYGGGGIMPDIFVAIDTTQYTDFSRDVIAKGVLASFSTGYIDKNRNELKSKYPDITVFDEKFEITPEIMNDFTAAAEAEGIERNDSLIERSRPYLATALKALIASDIFERGAYYRIANTLDPVYREALRVITTPGAYEAVLTKPEE